MQTYFSKSSTPSPSFGPLTSPTYTSSRHHLHPPPPAASQPMRTKSSSGRQNPWQAQWINRSSEQTRDVFTCVWCKESFKSLAEMTDHMKRSPRCGMAGAEQTRQILKCMWCGQSFKSLADMTQHMKVTQHYTNIISQEQIISWRNPEESSSSSSKSQQQQQQQPQQQQQQSQQQQVLTCKVCDESFQTLKELSNHMVKNSHFKDQNSDCMAMSPQSNTNNAASANTTTSGKSSSNNQSESSDRHSHLSTTSNNLISFDPLIGRNLKKSIIDDNNGSEMDDNDDHHLDNDDSERNTPVTNQNDDNTGGNVLSALEKLIEKNFDTKSRRSQQTGILQRLGIDEEVFPPWQNMAPSPISPASMMAVAAAAWNPTNGGLVGDYSRSSSSNSNHSSNHHRGFMNSGGGGNSSTMVIPQLRYRRNSSSNHSFKDKYINAAALCKTITTESNGSFSSQETEEESCDDSNSEYVRPQSASSTASSSISPSETQSINTLVNPNTSADLLNRLTPNSHRSETDDDQDQSPLNLFKKAKLINGTTTTTNNNDNDTDDEDGDGDNLSSRNGDTTKSGSHHPLMQLQKLLDKTDNNGRRKNSSHHHHHQHHQQNNHRSSPFNHNNWNDSTSVRSPAGSSSERSPRSTPNFIGSPSSIKSSTEQDLSTATTTTTTPSSYLQMKCAFCSTPISSRNEYRLHLAKIHLSMRDSSTDISSISDEELLLLVLAKKSRRKSSRTSSSSSTHNNNAHDMDAEMANVAAAAVAAAKSTTSTSSSSSPPIETSQSKFLKYTELAKQLSSKYVK
ncbi:Teashirt 3 [Dermatophagoides pteronyssinus]|uniref:Teashirt 3 n=1 Tax=Dermatophagoides pteronyssinus TaxID=6956 RepID=A0ABQ8JA33_DERPT|nr:Teashirt 3 [Dermatophagoides pteronyssinus]